jgi:hypothetical protein
VAASFATNEHDEQDAQAGKVPPGGKAADAKRQKIIVAATIVGVLIAFITMRKSSSAPVGSTATVPVPPPASSAGIVASSGPSSGQGADLGSYLQNLTQQQTASSTAQTASLGTYLDNLTKQIENSNTALQSSLAPVLASALPPPLASAPGPMFDPTDTQTIRNDQTGEIFQVQQGGLLHLTPATYAALGKPTPQSHFEGAVRTTEFQSYSAQTAPAPVPATTPGR